MVEIFQHYELNEEILSWCLSSFSVFLLDHLLEEVDMETGNKKKLTSITTIIIVNYIKIIYLQVLVYFQGSSDLYFLQKDKLLAVECQIFLLPL